MKNYSWQKFAGRSIASILFVLAASAMWTACSEESGVSSLGDDAAQKIVVKTTQLESTPLMAGQTINAGTVSFSDLDTNGDGQDDTMEFCYNTVDGWEIVETHFWVGETRGTLPTNRSGNPVPGLFPYKSGALAAGTTKYCVRIPMSAINFSCPNTGSKDFFIA
ncbi:MAG: hypothetical protein ACKORJ_10035, partial [Bacteroidota bacterium]